MAEHIAGMRVEGTMVAGTGTREGRRPMQRMAVSGAVVALLAVALIAGMALHNRGASRPAVPVVSRAVTSQQARFLENNTTNLPNAVTADVRPAVVTSAQRRLLEVNTTMLPNSVATDVASPVVTVEQQKYLDVNTTWLPVGPSSPYMEEVMPLPGHPR